MKNEFYNKYLKDNWDGSAANDYFAKKYKIGIEKEYLHKPKNILFDNLLLIEIATNNVYKTIAYLAFEKGKNLGIQPKSN